MTFEVTDLKQWEERAYTSSKGNQNKWFANGKWYKEDGLGYESLSEIVVCRLLRKTNIAPVVSYEHIKLKRGNQVSNGCCSVDFMEETDDKLISLERLFWACEGEGALRAVLAYGTAKERVAYVVDTVERVTGLEDFGFYLKKIFTIDALFFNEDRHFHNIAVIQKRDGTYRECPIFDHGASLFSDVKNDYPLALSFAECKKKAKAKPFSEDFDEQLDACDFLYPEYEVRMDFSREDVTNLLDTLRGIYADQVLKRVEETLFDQMRKYSYLFG